jgi:hypothetical protein
MEGIPKSFSRGPAQSKGIRFQSRSGELFQKFEGSFWQVRRRHYLVIQPDKRNDLE